MKIHKITIKDFRAFKHECEIDLHGGKNLLLYGENGSGKSSLFQAMNLFFTPERDITHYQNIFVTTHDSFVRLEIGNDTGTNRYEWEETTPTSRENLILETAKTKGFLDYRSLLDTHYIHRDEEIVTIFNLLINNLIANIENPVTHRTYGEELNILERQLQRKKSKSLADEMDRFLEDLTAGLYSTLIELENKIFDIIETFDPNINVLLDLDKEALVYDPDKKSIERKEIELQVKYLDYHISNHHHFLNEARLSAIAISIYLGALLLNPPSELKILFLDDVLIGLDMSNRIPLLDILEKYFSDWQIILATYDKVWFDMAWQQLQDITIPGGRDKAWTQGALICHRDNECDGPIVFQDNIDYLQVAKQHLSNGDLRAGAIYIRAAYEREMKCFCDKCSLPLCYCEDYRKQKAEEYWNIIKKQKLKAANQPLIESSLIRKVQLSNRKILNELSHTASVQLTTRDVEKAHNAITELRDLLQNTKKADLKKTKVTV